MKIPYLSIANFYGNMNSFTCNFCISRTYVFIVLCHFLFSVILFSQNQNNQWRFGTRGGISFNSLPPVWVSGSGMATSEGSASVADRKTGSLLFYTDGIRVWDARDNIMPNGRDLLGGTPILLSSTTAAVIIPKPGSETLYYIITADEQSSDNGVRYSLVDMTLNGGFGDVVVNQKNIPLLNTTSEKLETIPASNEKDIWLITHDNPGNSFYAYLVTNSGIQEKPVISKVGGVQGNGAGHLKVSTQYNKLACGSLFDGTMEMFDFNNATGVVSNATIWKLDSRSSGFTLVYGVEFSPDGKLLYISNLNTIIQYNISTDIAAEIEKTAFFLTTGGTGQPATLQLGPDEKIYVNNGTIGVIQCPNQLGAECSYNSNAFENQQGGGGYGLPKWVYYPEDLPKDLSTSITYNDSCIQNSILFSIISKLPVLNATWNFGDPDSGINNTSDSLNPSHLFSKTGTFNVQSIVTHSCGQDTLFSVISIRNCDSTSVRCNVYVPNVFTPDSDGFNDGFQPKFSCEPDLYECIIYNNWGEQVFKSIDPSGIWDGRFRNSDCPSGVYVYVIKYRDSNQNIRIIAKDVLLLR